MQDGRIHIKTILLADDDIDDRELFEDALRSVSPHCTLRSAENGRQAIEMLQNGVVPDLLFLDMNMPVKNGSECLRDIKQDPLLQQLPVIIFSTSFQPVTAETVYKAGASLYVVKPDSFPVLKSVLHKILTMDWKAGGEQVTQENFILQG